MIEPNYKSLNIYQLRKLCKERGIEYALYTPCDTLAEELLDYDYEKAVSQLNPE